MTWLVFSDVSTRLLWETVSSSQHKQRICISKLAMMIILTKRYTMMRGQNLFLASFAYALHITCLHKLCYCMSPDSYPVRQISIGVESG